MGCCLVLGLAWWWVEPIYSSHCPDRCVVTASVCFGSKRRPFWWNNDEKEDWHEQSVNVVEWVTTWHLSWHRGEASLYGLLIKHVSCYWYQLLVLFMTIHEELLWRDNQERGASGSWFWWNGTPLGAWLGMVGLDDSLIVMFDNIEITFCDFG